MSTHHLVPASVTAEFDVFERRNAILHQNYQKFEKSAGTYGPSTTHLDKLRPLLDGGSAGG